MNNVEIKNAKVLIGGKFEKTAVYICDGKITFSKPKGKHDVIDAAGALVLPSLFDIHTHLRCPGQEYKEDLDSVTKAAVHGGYTDISSMPNTSPPADNEALINYIKLEGAVFKRCRIHPFGTLTLGSKGERLSRMGLMKKAGAVGVTDDGKCISNGTIMMRAMEYANTHGLFIMDHAEDHDISANGVLNEGVVSEKLGLTGIPEIAETIVIKRDIEISRYLNIPMHITHVSTKRGAELILAAKKDGIKITFDVTPHHLAFTDEDCLSFDTNFKVNPPLRLDSDRTFLIDLIKKGLIDAIGTDHAPHADFEKEYPFDRAPFGISSLDTAFCLLYATLTVENKIPLEKWIGLISSAPRKLLGLRPSELEEGQRANIFIFHPKNEWKVDRKTIYSKGKNTPLQGKKIKGEVLYTFNNGKMVYPF
ncbi:dihydroorotase [bacterium]|nr:dihydroorotase [bacterium]